MAKSKRRIIWAVDPFEEKNETRTHLLETLRGLQGQNTIEPVYVLSPDEYDLTVEFSTTWLKQIRPNAEKVLSAYLEDIKKETHLSAFANPTVIVEKRPSLTRAVSTLATYAKRKKADTILVGTHAKRGLSRLFLGSFAETLLLHSRIPVLVVGPHSEDSHISGKSSRILFSTDFGPASFPTFKRVIALAKSNGSKVTLFHCLPHPVEPLVQSGVYLIGGGLLSFPEFSTLDEKRKYQIAKKYVSAAKKLGVVVDIGFNPGRGNTALSIVKKAQEEKADLIAMAAESGAVSAALIGSITRQVVRTAPCPVWVMRAP